MQIIISVCYKCCYALDLKNHVTLLKENHKAEVVKVRQFSMMSGEQTGMDFLMVVLSVMYLPLRSYLCSYNWNLFLDLICVRS